MKNAARKNRVIKKKYTGGRAGHVLDACYFYYETAPDDHRDLAIVCGGYEKCAPDFEINRGNYPYYFVKCTLRGKGSLEIKNQRYELRPGTLTGFSPGTAHRYKADPKNPMEHIFITFVGSEAESLMQAGRLAETGLVEPVNPSEVLNLIEKMYAVGLEKLPYSQQICCSYLRILLLGQAQNTKHRQKHFSQSKATFLECKKYIDDHFSSLSSHQEAADTCGVNPRYMSTLFKRYSQYAPHEYIMRLKLNQAANLLLATSLSVKEIAYTIGFEDPYHFSRNFKKFHHLSPRDYRDRWGTAPEKKNSGR